MPAFKLGSVQITDLFTIEYDAKLNKNSGSTQRRFQRPCAHRPPPVPPHALRRPLRRRPAAAEARALPRVRRRGGVRCGGGDDRSSEVANACRMESQCSK